MKTGLFVLLCLSIFNAKSNHTIPEIDQLIAAVNKRITIANEAIDSENIFPMIETNCRLTKAAIGTVDTKVKLYFDRKSSMVWSDYKNEEILINQATIQKVEMTLSSQAYTINLAYYYDEIGLIIAHSNSEKEENECKEELFYFGDQKIIAKKITQFNCTKPNKSDSDLIEKFTLAEQMIGQTILKEATDFKMLLEVHYGLLMAH